MELFLTATIKKWSVPKYTDVLLLKLKIGIHKPIYFVMSIANKGLPLFLRRRRAGRVLGLRLIDRARLLVEFDEGRQ